MIYSEQSDALPAAAKDAIYNRMWRILSGQEKTPEYVRLLKSDRTALVEILRSTKSSAYFHASAAQS